MLTSLGRLDPRSVVLVFRLPFQSQPRAVQLSRIFTPSAIRSLNTTKTSYQARQTMGSIAPLTPDGVKLPTIKLDMTLAELYRRACPENADTRVGWISCGATSAVDLTSDVSRNTKFIYQDQAFVMTPRDELSNDNMKLRRSLAVKYLTHIPQRDAFVSGDTPVILFNLGRTPEEIEHDRRDAEATISVLDPSQRPELIFCPGPAEIPFKQHRIDRLAYKVIIDGLEGHPLTHSLETHWLLNSKAGLARSGLPTPKTTIIDHDSPPPAPSSCCAVCAEADVAANGTTFCHPSIPEGCTGRRLEWFSEQMNHTLKQVRSRPVPFVFKTQQAFGGAGTWLVKTEEQKDKLLRDVFGERAVTATATANGTTNDTTNGTTKREEGLLRKLLPLANADNAHLNPTTVLLTDLVPDVVGDYGLTFVVTSSGEAEFLAAAEQMLTSDGSSAWIGSTIHYRRQGELYEKFGGLMRRIARWVAKHGYVGPVGADVLESKSGECFVVDLNVRTCGSVSLPLLRGHFTSRGLWCASSFSIGVKGGRRGFIEKWRKPFEEGRMLILSWYEEPDGGESLADVVVGGEDEERLAELMKGVRESTDEVTF